MQGSSTLQYEPVSPTELRRKYSGRAITVAGTSTPPRTVQNSASLAGNSYFAKA